VKHAAAALRLARFFGISFIITFLVCSGAGALFRYTEAAASIPASPFSWAAALVSQAWNILPVALYFSLLISLCYSCQRKMGSLVSFLALCISSIALVWALSLGLSWAGRMSASIPPRAGKTLGQNGLVLSQEGISTVILGAPGEAEAPRIIALNDRSLIYQKIPINEAFPPLPEAPFDGETAPFMINLNADLHLSGLRLSGLLSQGWLDFLPYLGSLCFFLISLRFVFTLTSWPLTNLILGTLLFRGVMAFENYLPQSFILIRLQSLLPQSLAIPGHFLIPLIFCALAFIALFISFCIRLITKAGRKQP
jgi:hypothetical protein